jgi:hypothetical protein
VDAQIRLITGSPHLSAIAALPLLIGPLLDPNAKEKPLNKLATALMSQLLLRESTHPAGTATAAIKKCQHYHSETSNSHLKIVVVTLPISQIRLVTAA